MRGLSRERRREASPLRGVRGHRRGDVSGERVAPIDLEQALVAPAPASHQRAVERDRRARVARHDRDVVADAGQRRPFHQEPVVLLRGRMVGRAEAGEHGPARLGADPLGADVDDDRPAGRRLTREIDVPRLERDPERLAAVDHERLAGDVAGLVRGQEAHGGGDIGRLPEAAERDRLQVLRPDHRVFDHELGDAGVHDPRGDRVDADPVRAQIHRRRADEGVDATLRGVVDRHPALDMEAVDRGRDDDGTAPARGHRPARLLRAQEDAGEVHGEHVVPGLVVELEQRPDGGDAGMGDAHVDVAGGLETRLRPRPGHRHAGSRLPPPGSPRLRARLRPARARRRRDRT